MTRTEIVAITIRLLAAWFFLNVVSLMAFMPPSHDNAGAWGRLSAALVPLALAAGVFGLTWKFSVLLADKVLPEKDAGAQVVPLSSRDLEHVALRVLGAFLVCIGLGGLGHSVTYAAALANLNDAGNWVQQLGGAAVAPQFVQYLIEFLAGILLFMGRTGLRRFLGRLRGEAQEDSETRDDTESASGDAVP